ncbi:D-amino-acid oxidase [Allostella vacuolata]|nr:D-amino-acid oxidase [Stella vacuolata]
MNDRPHILVVGAGIVGAAIAWHLARDGARVTLVEAGEPGGVATRRSLAWINAGWGAPEPYVRLRVHAMAEWRRLAGEVPSIRVAWTGGLLWDQPPDRLRAWAARHAAWGCAARLVDRAEAARLEPALASPPQLAVHAPGEGAVEPLATALALLADARRMGVGIVTGRPALALGRQAGRVVGIETATGALAADLVVLAAGAGTAALAAGAGLTLPVADPPALLLATRPCAPLLNGLVLAPALHLRQDGCGRLVASAGFDGRSDLETAGRRLLDDLRRLLRGGAPEPEQVVLGRRPIPLDGLPIVGPAPGIAGLYVAVLHSGVTLAPAIGRLVAEEIRTGRRDPLLAPCEPSRIA